ncbi:MAG: tetratricopeptide repeat protein [Planctomycetota bacterium]|jgi:TolA-binding protein
MTKDKIEHVLRTADQMAGPAKPVSANLASAVRRRAPRRRTIRTVTPIAAAVAALAAVGIWHLAAGTAETPQDQTRLVSIETQLAQLEARTDATLKLIQGVLERERQQRKLAELQAKLANIRDPLEEVQEQIEKTAFILVYQADRMYQERNQKDSAVQTYNRVIELFPQTRSAQTAKQRLSEIQNNPINENGSRI